MADLKQYDPSQVTIIFGSIISGYADGSFLSVERNEDSYTLQMGTDGEGTRSKSNNRSGRATFTLMQSSDSNDALSALHLLDESTPNGDGVLPLLIKDLEGRTIYEAEKAWIVKSPTSEFDREATSREWIIETHELTQFIGGN